MIINTNSAVSYVSPDVPEIETNFPAVKLFSAILFLGINSTILDGSCTLSCKVLLKTNKNYLLNNRFCNKVIIN